MASMNVRSMCLGEFELMPFKQLRRVADFIYHATLAFAALPQALAFDLDHQALAFDLDHRALALDVE